MIVQVRIPAPEVDHGSLHPREQLEHLLPLLLRHDFAPIDDRNDIGRSKAPPSGATGRVQLPISFRRKDKTALRQAIDLVRPDREPHFTPKRPPTAVTLAQVTTT
jgi:hypothetical protein